MTPKVPSAVASPITTATPTATPKVVPATIQVVLFNADLPANVISQAEMHAVAHALQRQVREQFLLPPPLGWGINASIRAATVTAPPTTNEWAIGMFSAPDVPGALGYHDRTQAGLPFSKIFPILDHQDNIAWSTTASHELLEMLLDPYLTLAAQAMSGDFYAIEACLTPETEVVLSDGSTAPIEVLASRGGHFSVRAAADGEQAVQTTATARRTGMNRSTLRIVFSDSTSVRCTPDHRFLQGDGTYIRADALRAGSQLRKVLPGATSAHAPNRRDRNAMAGGDDLKSVRRLADVRDSLSRELRSAYRFAAEIAISGHAALRDGVRDIFSMGAQEQMVGAYAGGIVTSMTNKKTLANGSFGPFIGKAMGRMDPASVANLTVLRGTAGTGPNPAASRLSHTAPEALFERGSAAVIGLPARGSVGRARLVLSAPMNGAEASGTEFSNASIHGTSGHTKVVARIEVEEKSDVYDLHVPDLHNFALASGIFAHNCDACEMASYNIGGVLVSDFVLPSFFQPPDSTGPGTRYDSLGLISAPWQLLPGGYAIYYEAATQTWKQQFAEASPPRAARRAAMLRDDDRAALRTRLMRSRLAYMRGQERAETRIHPGAIPVPPAPRPKAAAFGGKTP